MPLRDHFRPPISDRSSWEGFHGMWPAIMVQQLVKVLPREYTAEPRVHLGDYYEVDVGTFEEDPGRTVGDDATAADSTTRDGPGEGATALYAPPAPTLVLDTDLDDQYAYEVLVFDQTRHRQLVAAVEICSPANKDRTENRRAFVAKCAALLREHICVSIVDLVTIRSFNLYCDLLELIGRSDPSFNPPPATYAVTCRGHKAARRSRFAAWAYPLVIGQRLPSLPIWLMDNLAVSLDLEASYEETCQGLRIPSA
ncbi:MAG: DUF4058 family protein [Planctomycetes bacterium]|nr:DUF4058 family protein [Planctomycetota bacterium]